MNLRFINAFISMCGFVYKTYPFAMNMIINGRYRSRILKTIPRNNFRSRNRKNVRKAAVLFFHRREV